MDEKNTQVDASNHKQSLWDNHTLYRRSTSVPSPFPGGLFPGGDPLSKEFRHGELDGHEPFPFPLGSRSLSGSCFVPHSPPREN